MSRYTYEGPRWYRGRIRSRGPFVALLPPLALGVFALLLINVGNSSVTGLTGLVLAVMAAPGLLVVGAPFSSSSLWPVGIALSVVLWLAVGYIAARRATRNPMATWSDFWRDFAVLAIGVCLGAAVAVTVAKIAVGEILSF
jgi:hypothetical protein